MQWTCKSPIPILEAIQLWPPSSDSKIPPPLVPAYNAPHGVACSALMLEGPLDTGCHVLPLSLDVNIPLENVPEISVPEEVIINALTF